MAGISVPMTSTAAGRVAVPRVGACANRLSAVANGLMIGADVLAVVTGSFLASAGGALVTTARQLATAADQLPAVADDTHVGRTVRGRSLTAMMACGSSTIAVVPPYGDAAA